MAGEIKQKFLSLDKKLLALVLAVNFVFTLVWSVVDLYFQRQNDNQSQAQDMHYIEQEMIPVISHSLWNLDRRLAEVQLQGILAKPFVVGVRVYEGDDFNHPTIEVKKNETFNSLIEKRYDLSSPITGQRFATIDLQTTSDPQMSRLRTEAIKIFISETLETLILSLLILYAFRVLVLNHLSQISRYFRKNHLINPSTPHFESKGSRYFRDEIDNLTDSINRAVEDSKRHQMQIEELKDHAEKANEAKSMFLASINHELRTPLNAILGVADLIPETLQDRDQLHQLLDIQKRSGVHLLHLVDEILDFSKIEAGEVRFQVTPFDLRNSFESVHSIMEKAVLERRNHLILEVDPQLPPQILGDSNRINQILINLISNANKFTDQGRIRVRAQRIDSEILLTVKDTGIGIPQDKISEIFLPFRQLESSGQKLRKGTGIGLSITRRLVELMGGKIEVESQVGVGSEFKVRLPLKVPVSERIEVKAAKPPAPEAASPSKKTQLKLLVVEDTPEIKMLIKAFLKGTGVELSFAENGKEGLDDVLREHYNLVLMDLQMPVMNGYEATQKIRAFEEQNGQHQHVPILALTALTTKRDIDLALESGCDGYVTKPFSRSQLLETLQKYAAS